MKLSGHTDWIRGLSVKSVGSDCLVASISDDATCRVWSLESGAPVASLPLVEMGSAIAFAPNSLDIVVATGSALARYSFEDRSGSSLRGV
ncbi:hypothetical protein AGMMS50218_16930 [Actinomycetota bacterium]|nr:hypothetical protein AGMMS50218_16930 [Actinomycetota bacterium]